MTLFTCHICDRTYVSEGALKRHKDSAHLRLSKRKSGSPPLISTVKKSTYSTPTICQVDEVDDIGEDPAIEVSAPPVEKNGFKLPPSLPSGISPLHASPVHPVKPTIPKVSKIRSVPPVHCDVGCQVPSTSVKSQLHHLHRKETTVKPDSTRIVVEESVWYYPAESYNCCKK